MLSYPDESGGNGPCARRTGLGCAVGPGPGPLWRRGRFGAADRDNLPAGRAAPMDRDVLPDLTGVPSHPARRAACIGTVVPTAGLHERGSSRTDRPRIPRSRPKPGTGGDPDALERPRIPFQSTTLGEGDFRAIADSEPPPAASRTTASVQPERSRPPCSRGRVVVDPGLRQSAPRSTRVFVGSAGDLLAGVCHRLRDRPLLRAPGRGFVVGLDQSAAMVAIAQRCGVPAVAGPDATRRFAAPGVQAVPQRRRARRGRSGASRGSTGAGSWPHGSAW